MKYKTIVKLLNELEVNSVAPVRNKKLLLNYLKNDSITFYAWECMPGKTIIGKDNQVFFDFDIDIEDSINKSKFNQLIKVERKFFALLNKYKLNYKFYIFTADTNPSIMYPESKVRYSSKQLESLSGSFKKLMQNRADTLLGKNKATVLRFSKVMNKYLPIYQKTFNLIYNDLSVDLYKNKWVNSRLPKRVIKHLSNHIDIPMDLKSELEERACRYLASYAAEGVVFSMLNKSSKFKNLVWINNEIVGPSVVATELAIRKTGSSGTPVIFYFYDKDCKL